MASVKFIAILALLLAVACPLLAASDSIVYTIDRNSVLAVNYTETVPLVYEDNPKIGGSPSVLPSPTADTFCPSEGWTIVNGNEPFKLGNWTAHYVYWKSPIGCPFNFSGFYKGLFEVRDEADRFIGQYSVCPNQTVQVKRASDNKSVELRVMGAAEGHPYISSAWAKVWGRAENCSNSFQDTDMRQSVMVPALPANDIPIAVPTQPASVPLSDISSTLPTLPPAPLAPDTPASVPSTPTSASNQPSTGSGSSNDESTQPTSPTTPDTPTSTQDASASTPSTPTSAPNQQSTGSGAVGDANAASRAGTEQTYSQTSYGKSAPVSIVPEPIATAPRPELSQSAPRTPADALSTLPWWLAPALVASLGAFFMAVMVFYYRSPSIFTPAPSAPAPPIYLSDSRLALMSDLSQTERIPTDIAARLGKSKSTVSEQLDELCALGLVERISQEGKKFVFYRLSRTGRQALLQRADEQKKPAPLLPF